MSFIISIKIKVATLIYFYSFLLILINTCATMTLIWAFLNKRHKKEKLLCQIST